MILIEFVIVQEKMFSIWMERWISFGWKTFRFFFQRKMGAQVSSAFFYLSSIPRFFLIPITVSAKVWS